jgi:hypothetical protein
MSKVQPSHSADEHPSQFPFEPAGTAKGLFPPVCLRSHWDPTQMLTRYILPNQHVGLPMDFRPYVKVCKDYVTSAPAVEAPLPPSNMVFPMGGEFYPPGRYSENINDESKLHYLDRTLNKWCQTKEFVPSVRSDMYVPNVMVVRSQKPSSDFVQELAMPQAVLREDGYTCRTENDIAYWNRSPRLFSNPTKQDRYGAQTFSSLPGGVLEFPHGGVEKVPLTSQARAGAKIVGSMRQFGADGQGCAVDACGNVISVDPSGNHVGLGPIDMPGGPMPAKPRHIRPIQDYRPDRNAPIRISGITTASGYAPA